VLERKPTASAVERVVRGRLEGRLVDAVHDPVDGDLDRGQPMVDAPCPDLTVGLDDELPGGRAGAQEALGQRSKEERPVGRGE
jgi:hypothetical protein